MLHNGHIDSLRQAKELGDYLFVGLWSDDTCKYYKGDHFPLISLIERVLMTLACKYVDDVVIGAPY